MDVYELKEFYADPLGIVARRLISHRIRTRVRNVAGQRVMGLGYATPYLGGWRDDALAVYGCMPARQGVVRWPREGPNVTTLVDDADLPFPDDSIDVALIVHELEFTDNGPQMLREVWRVLSPAGRVVIVAPNRRGLWARRDSTPFGHGRPFSRGQLSKMLREAMFDPAGWAYALYVPPVNRGFLRRSAAAWERIGAWGWQGFAGVLIVEATKQVYATVPLRRAKRFSGKLRPVLVPGGARALGAPFSASAGTPPVRQTG
jgi:SAM-dependent methyltransferase